MSVEVTTLKSGITVVTDTMPHLETASLGVWVASGSRDEDAVSDPMRFDLTRGKVDHDEIERRFLRLPQRVHGRRFRLCLCPWVNAAPDLV